VTAPQLGVLWDAVKTQIRASLPVTADQSDEVMNNVHAALLRDEMQLWIGMGLRGDQVHVYGGLVTNPTLEVATGCRNLWIYALFIEDNPPVGLVREGQRTLAAFARARRCNRIVAITRNEWVLKLTELAGGDTSVRFVSVEV